MSLNPYTVAIIPAKMTSQRLPYKNLVDLCGNPLLYYSIEVAKHVSLIDEIYVSSEDENVLTTASSYNVKTIVRPKELSSPEITTQDVLVHAYNVIGEKTGKSPELIVLLQPTHPLRMFSSIEEALQKMISETDYDSLFVVMETDELRGRIIDNCFISEFDLPRNKRTEPKFYKNTGSFYIFRPDRSFLVQSFFGNKIYPYILDRSLFEIDIDYQSDLELARLMLSDYAHAFPHFKIEIKGDGH